MHTWRIRIATFLLAGGLGISLVGGTATAGSATRAFGVSPAAQQRAVAAPQPGWGKSAVYIGRYHLSKGSNPAIASSGELTVFTRIVPHQPAPVISGILALDGSDGTNVLYLTHFLHTPRKLWARVNLGIYTGPEIGTFFVISFHGNQMQAMLTELDGAKVSLTFVRFSHSPHP